MRTRESRRFSNRRSLAQGIAEDLITILENMDPATFLSFEPELASQLEVTPMTLPKTFRLYILQRVGA